MLMEEEKKKKTMMMKEIKEEKFLYKNEKKGKFSSAYLCGKKAYIYIYTLK